MTRIFAQHAFFLISTALLAQVQDSGLGFEVASVRPYVQGSGPTGTQGGPGSRDPERYLGRGMPLRLYLCVGFATADCQEQIAGPGWIDSEKYDIAANVPHAGPFAGFAVIAGAEALNQAVQL